MNNPLEFLDYIFDRYTYLGVKPTLSTEELRREIRRRRAENHPDKLAYVSEAIRQTAARDMDLVNDCAKILLDEELRARYDERLASFKEATPHLVSSSGIPIIDPGRFRIDLESLLDARVADLTELEAHAARLAGHNEKRVERARKYYAADPTDVDARDELREVLTAKLVFLSVMEDYYWQKAGVHGATDKDALARAVHSTDVLALLDSQLGQMRSKVEHAVVERHAVAQLGFVPLLLLGHHGSKTESAQVIHEVSTAAVKAFEMRIEDLKALVEIKKATIDELVQVPRSRMLRPDSGTGLIDVMLIKAEPKPADAWPGDSFTQLGVIMRCDIAAGAISSVMEIVSEDDIAAWPNELHVLEPNRELPGYLFEAVALAELLAESRTATADSSKRECD